MSDPWIRTTLWKLLRRIGFTYKKVQDKRLFLHLRPNYIHSASNNIHTDGPRARARARG